jgi:ATP-dependent Clp protease adapter protein ClpS
LEINVRFKEFISELEVVDRPPVRGVKEIPLNKPGGFNVVVLNDLVTPGEVVIEAMMSVLGLPRAEAMRRVMKAHKGGWAVCATYASADVAETKAELLMAHCRRNTNWDEYRTAPGIPRYPNGPGGFKGPWPTTFEVMEAGG